MNAWQVLVLVGTLAGCMTGAVAQEQPGAAGESAAAQPASDGRAIFEAAAAAVKRAQSITYRAKYYSTGGMATMMPSSEADVRMLRSGRGTWLVRTMGTGKTRTNPNVEFDVAYMGSTNEWVDHAQQKVLEKLPRDSKGEAFTIGNGTRLDELVDAIPFKNELAANTEYTLEPREEVGGVLCDVVSVQKGRATARWSIGVEDHLPRRRESIVSATAMSGSMILELSDVRADESSPPRMPQEMVRVAVPAGYTEERVAPPTAPVPPKQPVAAQPEPPKGVPTEDYQVPAPAPVEPPPPQVLTAPEFSLKTPAGDTVTLSSLRGKIVVLEFAGSWCIPLRDAHPELEDLAQRYKSKDVVVYLVNVREKSASNMVSDLSRGSFTFGLLLNGDATAAAYNIKRYPSYCVIDKDGLLKLTEAGFVKGQTMAAVGNAIEAALGNPLASPAPGE
jgi:thiol-disulfide isomerase/thioredoxin